MKNEEVIQANRAAWEEAAPLHRRQNMARLLDAVRQPDYSCLDEIETARLQSIGVANKNIAQLCCNNGRELISVKKMGAARCVGFDGAQGFIDQAHELTAAAGIDCEFICTDVNQIDDRFNANFDLITITIGVLSWMPELKRFIGQAACLLKPAGVLFIYEQHPVLDMIEPGKADDPVSWDYSYFKTDPFIETGGLDYYGGGAYESKPMYSFHYSMSDIIMAAITNDLRLEHFEELPGHISNTWYNVEQQGPRLPMSYTLILRKPS